MTGSCLPRASGHAPGPILTLSLLGRPHRTANLKILSLGRNNIKSLGGLDPVAGTLEELWISYNLVEKTKGIECLKNLKVLYMSNCKVKDWKEVDNMKALTSLETLVFNGNPLMEKHTADGGKSCRVLHTRPTSRHMIHTRHMSVC